MVSPHSPTSYTGIKNYLVAAVQPGKQSDPTSSDLQDPLSGKIYVVPTIWVNEATDTPWMFVGSTSGSASWIKLATPGGADVAGPASATDNAIARFDGTTGKLIQNSAVTIADTTGAIATGSGTVGLPTYSFTGDTDTGMYRIGANDLGFATAGVLGLEIGATQDVTASAGNLIINGAGKQLRMQGGAETDFIGQTALTAGVATVNNTNIAAGDRIFIQRASINGSTALGMFTYSISAGASFTITSVQTATPAATETNDTSVVVYHIIREI